MPRVCREYPRRTISYEAFAEIALELACPEVARLFLEEKEPLSLFGFAKIFPRNGARRQTPATFVFYREEREEQKPRRRFLKRRSARETFFASKRAPGADASELRQKSDMLRRYLGKRKRGSRFDFA